VVSLSESVTVPCGGFDNCLQTREFIPPEPDFNKYKYYAPEIGMVLEVGVKSGVCTELIDVNFP
jgi:hypothetical protein